MRDGGMTKTPDSFETLRARIAAFVAERDWEQFHNPKNLAMALSAEAGELLEHFQWLTPAQARLASAARVRITRYGDCCVNEQCHVKRYDQEKL